MKRIIAFVLSIVCVFAIGAIGASAAENDTANLHEIFDGEYCSFGKGMYECGFDSYDVTSPSGAVVYHMTSEMFMGDFSEYLRKDSEYDPGFCENYYVPADVFEGYAGKVFAMNDDVIRALRSCDSYVADGDGHVYVVNWIGGGGGPSDKIVYRGYEVSGNDYILYGIVVDFMPSEDIEGAVEGVDYIMVEEDGEAWPCDILGAYKMTVSLSGSDALCKGYVKIDAADIVGNANIVSPDAKAENDEVVYDVPENVKIDASQFSEGYGMVTAYATRVTDGAVYNRATSAMTGISDNIEVYEIGVYNKDGVLSLTGAMPVSFAVVGDADDVNVYFITADGKAVELDSNVVNGYVNAGVEQFGAFVVAYVTADDNVTPPEGGDDNTDKPGDGDGTTTPPEGGDDNTDKPGDGDGTTTPPEDGDDNTDKPGDGDGTTTPPEGGDDNTDKPGDGDGTTTPPEDGDDTPDAPQTGDDINIYVALAIIAFASCVVVLTYKNKKND